MKSICKRKATKDLHINLDPLIHDKIRRHCQKNNIRYRNYITKLVAQDLEFCIDDKGFLVDKETELKCIDKQLNELLERKQELMEMEVPT